MTEAAQLRLFSAGLLSKWGFGDGDVLEDYLWDNELMPEGVQDVDDHAALRRLVREHLVPVLRQNVTVYDIETIHNPIRASHVNGLEVPHEVEYGEVDAAPELQLTPEYVEIPADVVLRACGLEVVAGEVLEPALPRVVLDETLPPGVVELRGGGRVLGRIQG